MKAAIQLLTEYTQISLREVRLNNAYIYIYIYISNDINNQSGIYQLQCNECPLKYVGQTGRTFKVRYKEHIQAIRTNKRNSKYAQHILDTGHTCSTIDETLEILHIEK
jgi:hypothetical protein